MTRGGRILALSYTPGGRTGGWQPWVGMGSAKAALDSMCRYFAVALGRHGITVNTISPGCCDETTVLGQTPQAVQDAVKNWAESRSEEHTSELQSRLHLVCRLLLEKKKKK